MSDYRPDIDGLRAIAVYLAFSFPGSSSGELPAANFPTQTSTFDALDEFSRP